MAHARRRCSPGASAARRRSSATRAPRRSRRRSSTRARRPASPGSSRSRARSTAGRPARWRRPASPRSAPRSSRSLPGVTFAQLNDVASLEAAVGPDTGLILLEPVQGEGGVQPATPGFLGAAAELAAEHGALLCFDEVQTGVGRTGSFFAFEQRGVRPHLVTLAKGLANGLPIGALLAADDAPIGFEPGDHASTFGGNPVVCAAACAVVETVDEELLENVRERSAQLAEALPVRGAGLLLGARDDARRRRGPRRLPRRRPARHLGRPDHAPSSPAAHRHARGGRPGDLDPPGGLSVTAHRRERQGAILRLIRERRDLDPGRARPTRCARPATRPCRRPSPATSPSSGSSRCAPPTAGSSTRPPAPPTSTACASSSRRSGAGR